MAFVEFAKEYQYTYTDTGTKDELPIDPTRRVTIGVVAGASDDYDLEVQLIDSGDWIKIEEGLAGNTVKVIEGPIIGFRLDIDTNTSTDIELNVKQAQWNR